jgi:hypothetical protein
VFDLVGFISFDCNHYFVFPIFDLCIESCLLHFCSIMLHYISLYYSASSCTAYSTFLSFAIICILARLKIAFRSLSTSISSPSPQYITQHHLMPYYITPTTISVYHESGLRVFAPHMELSRNLSHIPVTPFLVHFSDFQRDCNGENRLLSLFLSLSISFSLITDVSFSLARFLFSAFHYWCFRSDEFMTNLAIIVLLYYTAVWALVSTLIIHVTRHLDFSSVALGWLLVSALTGWLAGWLAWW